MWLFLNAFINFAAVRLSSIIINVFLNFFVHFVPFVAIALSVEVNG